MKAVILQPEPQAWLSSSVISPYQNRYVARLREDRYAHNVIRVYLASVAHFARWLSKQPICLPSLSEAVLDRFLNEHLPICSCPQPVRRTRYELRTAIRHLLRLLEAEGTIRPADEQDERSKELAAFDAYMRDVGGLAETTRRQRRRIVGDFLAHVFGTDGVIVTRIDTEAIRRFVLGEGHDWGAGAVRVAGSSVGCYLRYRRMLGDEVARLLRAIPRAAHWRLAPLPEILSPAEIDVLLASFSANLPSGRRSYAMVRCVTDLGLRCAEVVKLRIDDIDWRDGTVRIARSKTHFTDCLPLPKTTGEAIADYLRYETITEAPDASSWAGQRDRAMFSTMYNTGARVSEMIGTRWGDVVLEGQPAVHLHGKGRKDRSVPLWRATASLLRGWRRQLSEPPANTIVFPNRSGGRMTRSNVTQRLQLAVEVAARRYPALIDRAVTPHVIRHTTAMHLLQSGVDITVIALWLGHEDTATTHMYVEADLTMKEQALVKLQPAGASIRRFRAPDELMSFLQAL